MIWQAEDCCICLNSLSDKLVTVKCGHVFHNQCLIQSLETSKRCPLCRIDDIHLFIQPLLYELCKVEEQGLQKIEGLTDEEAQQVFCLQAEIQKSVKSNQQLEARLMFAQKQIQELEEEKQLLQRQLNGQDAKFRELHNKYQRLIQEKYAVEAELQKFTKLFQVQHKQCIDLKQKVERLESTAKLVENLNTEQATIQWIESIKAQYSHQQQVILLENAFLIADSNKKSTFNDLVEAQKQILYQQKCCKQLQAEIKHLKVLSNGKTLARPLADKQPIQKEIKQDFTMFIQNEAQPQRSLNKIIQSRRKDM